MRPLKATPHIGPDGLVDHFLVPDCWGLKSSDCFAVRAVHSGV